jgi:uncharacterized protein DUF3667
MTAPETATSTAPCPNCQAAASGVHCSSCGQQLDIDPKSVRAWVGEFLDETLDINGRLPLSLKALLLRPGHLTTEWEAGRRAQWTQPLRLYLSASVLFLVVIVLTPAGDSANVSFTDGSEVSAPIQSSAQSSLVAGRMRQSMRDNYAYAMFVLVPVFALFLKLLYRKSSTVYVGHLVHALHIHAAFFLFFAFLGPFEDLPSPWDYVVQVPILLWAFVYPILSARRVYGTSWIGTALRTFLLMPVYLIAVLIGLLTAVFASGITITQSDEADALYWEARNLTARGDSAGASERIPEVVDSYLRIEYAHYDTGLRVRLADAYLRAGAPDAAALEAERILAEEPSHLLALGIGAEAATALGDVEGATVYWRRFVDAYGGLEDLDGYDDLHRLDIIRYAHEAERVLTALNEEGG